MAVPKRYGSIGKQNNLRKPICIALCIINYYVQYHSTHTMTCLAKNILYQNRKMKFWSRKLGVVLLEQNFKVLVLSRKSF